MPQTFEDLTVEKEVAVRRRLAKESVSLMSVILTFTQPPHSFNKRREDFADLRLYNDYLEMVEDISKIFSPF